MLQLETKTSNKENIKEKKKKQRKKEEEERKKEVKGISLCSCELILSVSDVYVCT